MATTQTQLRRGTSAQVNAMTPAEGEVVVDMTNDRLNVGDGIRSGGYPIPNFSDNQKNTFGYGVASGSADALTLALSPALLSYVEGVSIEFRSTTTNTGAATINVNGLGAISIRQQDLSVLTAGLITSGRNYKLTYNGTYFLIMNAAPAEVSQSGLVFLGTATPSSGDIKVLGLFDPSLYSDYKLVFSGVNGTNQLRIQFSIDNGATWIGGHVSSLNDGTIFTGAAAAFIALGGMTSGNPVDGEVNIYSANNATTKVIAMLISNTQYMKAGTSGHSGSINAFRLYTTTNNITTGEIHVYGYAK